MSRKKKIVEPQVFPSPEPQPETTATVEKAKLQEIYNQRPVYVGLEFQELHKFYSKLEELLK